jgi:hypothetical protein
MVRRSGFYNENPCVAGSIPALVGAWLVPGWCLVGAWLVPAGPVVAGDSWGQVILNPELNPDEWLLKFEIESRDVFAARKEIIAAVDWHRHRSGPQRWALQRRKTPSAYHRRQWTAAGSLRRTPIPPYLFTGDIPLLAIGE